MDSDVQLSCSYHDDEGRVQGPFDATVVLNWYLKGFFQDHHLMRFTDNGMSIGSRVTYETTLGELKRKFGEETPIPTTLKTLSDVGICGFVVRIPPKSRSSTKHEERKQIKEEAARKDSPIKSPRSKMMAGPMLPPEMTTPSRKASTNSTSSSLKSEEKREVYLPFYEGSKRKPNDFLQKAIAIELGLFLQKEYVSMERDARKSMHDSCRALWKLPNKCWVCQSVVTPIPNFLSHVVSETHIKKCMDSGHAMFSFENDYLPLKKLFAKKPSVSNPATPKKSQPPSIQNSPSAKKSKSKSAPNAPPPKKSRSQRRADHRRAASPLRTDLNNKCTTS